MKIVSSHVYYMHAPSDQRLAILAAGEHTGVGVEAVAVVENGPEQYIIV